MSNTQWPHYGEALINGNTVINYRGLLLNNKPEILNQFSEDLKGRIRQFNPMHADVWNKVQITLKPYNNYYSFFLELKDILYKYRAGNNNSTEEFIGEEGAREIQPYLQPLAEFVTYVY
jgi:hypothetical protein